MQCLRSQFKSHGMSKNGSEQQHVFHILYIKPSGVLEYTVALEETVSQQTMSNCRVNITAGDLQRSGRSTNIDIQIVQMDKGPNQRPHHSGDFPTPLQLGRMHQSLVHGWQSFCTHGTSSED